MTGDYILCGWRVRSALALPELSPWQGDDRNPDVEISFAAIPKSQDEPVFVLPHSRLWANGDFLLNLENVGRFWVEGGSRVLVEPSATAQLSELRTFLLGSVLGVLCHQRGLLPIHASAVRINGGAVLITGISGAGKSTLAAALGARGHALVTDDVAAVDPNDSRVLPAFPQRKLAPDVLEALALEHTGLIANRPGLPKFNVPAPIGFDPEPLPPLAIYILASTMPEQSGEIERLAHAKAMAHLDRMIYRRSIGMKIQPVHVLFKAVARLAQAAPVYLLPLSRGLPLSGLDRLAERVESHAQQLQPASAKSNHLC
jgi:hypothetical protein